MSQANIYGNARYSGYERRNTSAHADRTVFPAGWWMVPGAIAGLGLWWALLSLL
ncbi:MAG TPA: hypothetical protein VGG48_17705 [Rhizomicrobium sp.]